MSRALNLTLKFYGYKKDTGKIVRQKGKVSCLRCSCEFNSPDKTSIRVCEKCKCEEQRLKRMGVELDYKI